MRSGRMYARPVQPPQQQQQQQQVSPLSSAAAAAGGIGKAGKGKAAATKAAGPGNPVADQERDVPGWEAAEPCGSKGGSSGQGRRAKRNARRVATDMQAQALVPGL